MKRRTILNQKVELLILSMQKFCLNPTQEKFNEICLYDQKMGDEFEIWKAACEYKYNFQSNTDFIKKENIICKKAVVHPTRSNALQILHIFFATGELKYIDLFYQCMGHELLSPQSRQYLSSVYKETKIMYNDEIQNLSTVNPEHFNKLGLDLSVVNFSHFDDIREKILIERQRISEYNKLLGL